MPEALPIEPLANPARVYRTVTRASDFQENRPLSGAFLRRATDTEGLSVDYDVSVPVGCGAHLSKKKAILGLMVGEIRATEFTLDVIRDSPTHANITGVPFYDDIERRERAEQIAARLVEISSVEWTRNDQRT